MAEIKVSIPDDYKRTVKCRAAKLEMSASEYFRTLSCLDSYIQRYQNAVTEINILYNNIYNIQKMLGIYATPLKDVPIIKLDEICNNE